MHHNVDLGLKIRINSIFYLDKLRLDIVHSHTLSRNNVVGGF